MDHHEDNIFYNFLSFVHGYVVILCVLLFGWFF